MTRARTRAKTTTCSAPNRAGRPPAEEAKALYDRILDAGWDLLLSQGFERFSIDRMARFARVGKPTIYARFENKAELLREILIKRIEWLKESVFSSIDQSDPAEAIPKLAAEAVSVFQSAEVRLIDRLIDWIDYEADARRSSLRGWTGDSLISTLEHHIVKANTLGATSIADPRAAATFLIEGISGHARISDARLPEARAAHLAWARQYWKLLKAGLSTDSTGQIKSDGKDMPR